MWRTLSELHAAPYELLTTPLNIARVQGLAATRRFDEAFALIDEAIHSVETNGDLCYIAELLRVKGNLFLAAPQPDVNQAETYFMRSLDASRRQGARAWELRSATDLAGTWANRNKIDRAKALLQLLLQQVLEGLGKHDFRSASGLLTMLD